MARQVRDSAIARPVAVATTVSTIGMLVIALVVTGLGAIARQVAIPEYRTVWAEDGQVFGQCAMTDPSPLSCLLAPYDGWIHIVPRMLAAVAVALPPERFSYSVTLLAAAAAGVAAVLVARAIVDATGSRVAAVAGAVGLTLIHPAGMEVAGNVTNLHWMLFVASLAVIACGWLGHRIDALDGALIVLTIASSPFGLVIVAFLVVDRLLRGRLLDPLLGIAAAMTIVQLAVALTSPRNKVPDVPVTILAPVAWWWQDVVLTGPFGGRSTVPDAVVTVALIAALIVLGRRAMRADRAPSDGADQGVQELAAAARSGRPWHHRLIARVPPAWFGPLAIVALVASGAAEFWAATYLNRHDAPRYTYAPVAILVVTAFLAIALAARPGSGGRDRGELTPPRMPLSGGVVIVAVASLVAIGFVQDFRLRTAASRGPDYPAEFRGQATVCGAGAVEAVVQLSPRPTTQVPTTWHLRIPCTRISS